MDKDFLGTCTAIEDRNGDFSKSLLGLRLIFFTVKYQRVTVRKRVEAAVVQKRMKMRIRARRNQRHLLRVLVTIFLK